MRIRYPTLCSALTHMQSKLEMFNNLKIISDMANWVIWLSQEERFFIKIITIF